MFCCIITYIITEKGLHRSDTDHQYPVSDTGFMALSDDALMSENVYNWEPMNMEAPVNHTHGKRPLDSPTTLVTNCRGFLTELTLARVCTPVQSV